MEQQKNILEGLNNSRIRAAIVPISRLADIKNEIIKFSENAELNDFQKYIVYDRYVLDLPELDFEPKSILIATTKYELVWVKFIWQKKIATDIFKLAYNENEIQELIIAQGFLSKEIFWLPQKRFAVQSGLAEYGRNNITFVPDWGSFFGIDTYMTNIPCEGNHIWRDTVCMDICNSCGLCIEDCPTGAIRKENFLIDNEICLRRIIETSHPLPDWIPPDAVHSLSGCFRCQLKCPPNKAMLKSIRDEIIFDECETNLLLDGVPHENLPYETQEKANSINLNDWRYDGVPRNLKIMFDNVCKNKN